MPDTHASTDYQQGASAEQTTGTETFEEITATRRGWQSRSPK